MYCRWNQLLNSLLVALTVTVSLSLGVAQAADDAPNADDHQPPTAHAAGEEAGHADDGHGGEGGHTEGAHATDGHDAGHGGNGHEDGEHHGDGHHGDDHHGEYSIFADLSFWAAIAFVGFVAAIFKLGLWNSLTTNMAAREKNEYDLIASADAKLAKAQAELTDYKGQIEAMDETIKATLEEAGRDAEHTHSEIVELANKEAEAALERARLQVNRVRDQSLLDIFTSVADRVGEATENAVKEKLSDADQDRLIDETLQQLASN